MLPLAIEFMSGLMYGLIACELSQVGICVEPGDTTLLDSRFVSLSSSVCKTNKMNMWRFLFSVLVDVSIHFDNLYAPSNLTYLNICCTNSMHWFPISIRIDGDFFDWRCAQCIQYCPNVLIDFKSFGQCRLTAHPNDGKRKLKIGS